jgi:hypothetical protein|nr:MAG TPA: hypothetical protein [Caudoviricetes sp.]
MAIFKEVKNVVDLFDPATKEAVEIDNKPYLLLFALIGEGTMEGEWLALRGRKTTFEYLKSACLSYDCLNSYVLTGGITLGKEVSLYSFMRVMVERYYQDEQDILDTITDHVLDTLNNNADDENKFFEEKDLDLIYFKEINSPTK